MSTSLVTVVAQVRGLLDGVGDVSAVGLTGEQLREILVGGEQLVNAIQAMQGQAMVEMGVQAAAADRAEELADRNGVWKRRFRTEFVPDEIAAVLACTKVAAGIRYDTACRAFAHASLGRAWTVGAIDGRKIAEITTAVADLENAALARDDDGREVDAGAAASVAVKVGAVVDGGIDYARTHTAPQLRQWLKRRVFAADPAVAEAARLRAVDDRRVAITPRGDGVSELWALLPSVSARQIEQILTTVAHHAGAEDGRSMDQRRADALIDLLTGKASAPDVHVQVVVPADTLTGVGNDPGWVPGVGAVTAAEARLLAGGPIIDSAGNGRGAGTGLGAGRDAVVGRGVTWRRLLVDPMTGTLTDVSEKQYRPSAALDRAVRARDVTCRFPGCRRAASSLGTDLDHTVRWPVGPTSGANLAVLCRRHHRLKHTPGWHATLAPDGTMTWTTPTGAVIATRPWNYVEPPPALPPSTPLPDG